MLSRRGLLGSMAAGVLGTASPRGAFAAGTQARKRMAIVTTVWRMQSHGQHMGDRFLHGYPINGRWHQPGLDVVSIYVDQVPSGDLSRQRAQEFGFRISPTIAE